MKYLVVGLGNPNMSGTRHNIGSDTLDIFIKNRVKQIQHNLFSLNENLYFFLCPDAMNISGQKVWDTFQKLQCQVLIVIVDDLDLEFSKVKTKFTTGSNGHNGTRDIMKYFQCNIWKILVGIGRPKDNTPIAKYVLQKFTPEEKSQLKQTAYSVGREIFNIINQNKEDFEFK